MNKIAADKIAQLLPFMDGVTDYVLKNRLSPDDAIVMVKEAGNAYALQTWGHPLFEWNQQPTFSDRVREQVKQAAEGGAGAPVGAGQAASSAPPPPMPPAAPPPMPQLNPFDFKSDPAVQNMLTNIKEQLDKKREEFQKQRDMTYAAAMQRTLPAANEMGQPAGGAPAPGGAPPGGAPPAGAPTGQPPAAGGSTNAVASSGPIAANPVA